jgi:hypothetical protein
VGTFTALAIDGDGRIVGTGVLVSGQPPRALRYDRRDSSVTALDDDATTSSSPLAVNTAGQVLGTVRTGTGGQMLHVWS